MEFDKIYSAHCSLRLQSGRQIILDRLIQSRTYAGLLEGTPDKVSNDLMIKSAMERIEKNDDLKAKPYLFEPERRDYFREPGDMQSELERQQDYPEVVKRIPEWLPQIECIGEFHSIHPARDKTKDASALTILWYQHDFGFDDRSIEHLRHVDWEQYAVDWEY